MKKLKLNLEDLKVESFQTMNDVKKRGTVVGNSGETCPPFTYPCDGCTGFSCPNTCYEQSCECTNHTACNQNTCQCPGETIVGKTCLLTCP